MNCVSRHFVRGRFVGTLWLSMRRDCGDCPRTVWMASVTGLRKLLCVKGPPRPHDAESISSARQIAFPHRTNGRNER